MVEATHSTTAMTGVESGLLAILWRQVSSCEVTNKLRSQHEENNTKKMMDGTLTTLSLEPRRLSQNSIARLVFVAARIRQYALSLGQTTQPSK